MQFNSIAELERLRRDLADSERTLGRNAVALAAAITPVWAVDTGKVGAIRLQVNTLLQRVVTMLSGSSIRAATRELPGPPDANFVQQVNRIRDEVGRWSGVQALLAAQATGERRPLYRDAARVEPILSTQLDLADAVYRDLHAVLRDVEQDPAGDADGAFGDIALPLGLFLQHVHAASRVARALGKANPRFLDVGCGVGLKVLAARHLFAEVAGLERDPGYAAAARRRLGPGATLIEADAADFTGYDRFDVVYLFRPMRDDAKMAQIEAHIAAAVAPDTLVVAPYRGFRARFAQNGFTRVARDLFLSASTAAATAEVAARAELIGPAASRAPGPALRSLWEPVLAASLANGYALPREPWADNA